MGKKEQLWERLAPIVVEREEGFGNITVGGATDQQGKDNLLDFISQELDKAREEERRETLEEVQNFIKNRRDEYALQVYNRALQITAWLFFLSSSFSLVLEWLSKLKQ